MYVQVSVSVAVSLSTVQHAIAVWVSGRGSYPYTAEARTRRPSAANRGAAQVLEHLKLELSFRRGAPVMHGYKMSRGLAGEVGLRTDRWKSTTEAGSAYMA